CRSVANGSPPRPLVRLGKTGGGRLYSGWLCCLCLGVPLFMATIEAEFAIADEQDAVQRNCGQGVAAGTDRRGRAPSPRSSGRHHSRVSSQRADTVAVYVFLRGLRLSSRSTSFFAVYVFLRGLRLSSRSTSFFPNGRGLRLSSQRAESRCARRRRNKQGGGWRMKRRRCLRWGEGRLMWRVTHAAAVRRLTELGRGVQTILFGRLVHRSASEPWTWTVDGGAPLLLLPAIDAVLGPADHDGKVDHDGDD